MSDDFMIIDDLPEARPAPTEAAVGRVFQPGRAYRRSVAGQECPACKTRIHHADVVVLRTDTDLIPLHGQCALAIAERAGTETEETDDTL